MQTTRVAPPVKLPHRFPMRTLLGLFAAGITLTTLAAFDGRLDDDQQKPAPAPAPTASSEKINVPFSDPARPGRLTINIVNGSIRVTGYEGKEVIVVARADEDDDRRDHGRTKDSRTGLRRIPNTASGLTIEEERNEMRISSDPNREILIDVQVPSRTALKLSTVNNGNIVVERVDSEMEVSNVNGDVTLTNVAGSGVVHSTNGELKASFSRITGKPMSFITVNGDVDVSLPADLKADLRLDSGNGEIYTDFAIDMQPSVQRSVEDKRSEGGKYRIKVEKVMLGKINGGGVEYTLKTFNGDIHLRRYTGAAQ